MRPRLLFLSILACCLLTAMVCGTAGAEGLRGYDQKAGYQYAALGAWPQGENGETSPILWRVLSAEDGEVLLLSEYILGNGWLHKDYLEYVSFGGLWNRTDMYRFLNGEFLENAFAKEELPLLLEDEELGRVFLLSSDDLGNKAYGFINNQSRMAKGTVYAIQNGLFLYSTKFSPYWTRTQSSTLKSGARCLKVKGNVGYIRTEVENEGWRPALRVNLALAGIASGEGTIQSPFQFSALDNPGAP